MQYCVYICPYKCLNSTLTLQTYIASSDKTFAASTIEAIGRVACSMPEVTETCLHGLMGLLSHKDGECCVGKGSSMLKTAFVSLITEAVVGESVVVIKKLLQLNVSVL